MEDNQMIQVNINKHSSAKLADKILKHVLKHGDTNEFETYEVLAALAMVTISIAGFVKGADHTVEDSIVRVKGSINQLISEMTLAGFAKDVEKFFGEHKNGN